jgi:hypothetical protein
VETRRLDFDALRKGEENGAVFGSQTGAVPIDFIFIKIMKLVQSGGAFV